MVNAVDFDIFAYILPMLERRWDKAQEKAWVGTTLNSNATAGKVCASYTAFTYLEWMAFEQSVPAAYRSDMGFVIADGAYFILRSLVDIYGRPIMDLDPQNSFQSMCHGKPVIVSDYVPTVAQGHKICFACSAEAVNIFDAGMKRIARYILQSSFPDQTGFELFGNGDCGFVYNGVRSLDIALSEKA